MKRNLLKNDGVQSLLASLACIVLGLFLGYVVLLIINPAGAGEAILTVIKNFLTYNKPTSFFRYGLVIYQCGGQAFLHGHIFLFSLSRKQEARGVPRMMIFPEKGLCKRACSTFLRKNHRMAELLT